MLAVALAVLLALPSHGVLVPGKSLGGVRLGAGEAQLRKAWGPRVGVCRGCPRRTLYFNYGPFDQTGAGAEFRRGRAIALYTLWLPTGWRTDRGVSLGDSEATVTAAYGALPRTDCGHYSARVLRLGRVVTAFWFRDDGTLWAFGLLRPSVAVCR